jgi:POT family proton-dependent oligopeptide transporter
MDTERKADDAVTARKPAPAGPDQITDRPPPPAGHAAYDGGGDFVLPTNPVARFFKSHPIGFWFFFWGEFAERSSYYGMRAILALYMAEKLGLGEANAATYNSFFIAATYFLPLVGGFVADRFFGKYWTIVGFSLPYILGHVILGVENFWFMVFALCLLAMGSGVIKPNISTLMGLTYDQQRPGQKQLRSDAFAMFYGAINIGAALSQLAMPWIRTHYGYQLAFLFPAGLMVISFTIFAAGKPFYAKETRVHTEVTPEQRREQWSLLGKIGLLFVLVMFFWAIFDQGSSTWIFFANVHMDLRLFGYVTDPDQIQAFNPVFIILLLPFRQVILRWLKLRATDQMIGGFLLTAACMGIMALAAFLAGPSEKAMRLALKNGEIGFTRGRLVYNHKTIDVKDGTIAAKDDAFTLTKGAVVTPQGDVPLNDAKLLFADASAEFSKDGTVAVNSGKVFFDDATLSAPGGRAEVKGGKVTSAEGSLETQGGKLVLKEGGKALLQPDEYAVIENKVSVWWQVLAYFIITIAEVLISVTGLELAYAAAPKAMTGFVTACWLMTVGMANLFINAPVTRLYTAMPPVYYFSGLAGTLFVVTIAFFFVAIPFNRAAAKADEIPLPEMKDDALPAAADGQTDIIEGDSGRGITRPGGS